MARVFRTNRRIKLGIWGLGRGMSFYRACRDLHFEVVAGCDFNEHLRDRFRKENPGAFVTDDAEEFLAAGFDAVLLATYCPAHADHAIRCLEAGKHVLSEVTAFFTMAQGVRLVEAVERSGRVYNMAENYPYTRPNLWLADQWRRGLFGDLMYAEYEYVHEIRELAYCWLDGSPIQPGWTVHNWRSWLNFHYYNTHSLGPVMHITGARPVRVVALPSGVQLPGYPPRRPMDSIATIAPSLISLDNGGLMRNLMGSTTNDTHHQRLWGTLGAAELDERGLRLRLGGAGSSPKLAVEPRWPDARLGRLADRMGHWGGDFWVLHQFARHILEGKPAFFDVYRSADCTIPGLLAYRSAVENGKPYDVPDFRKRPDRNRWRRDTYGQPPFDVKGGMFPAKEDRMVAGEFTAVMKDLIRVATLRRAALDWAGLGRAVQDRLEARRVAARWAAERRNASAVFARALRLIRSAPGSTGARALQETVDLAAD